MRQARAGHDTCGQRVTPRCRWAAGPGRTTSRRAERSSRRGRLTGGSPPTGTHSDQAPQVWRAPEGPEGTGGLRDNAPRHTPACQSPPMWRGAGGTGGPGCGARGRRRGLDGTTQHRRRHRRGGRRRDRRAWLRCPWAVAGPGRHHTAPKAPPAWRASEGPEGLAAVPVGGGGAWTAPHSTEGATGVEGAGGSGGHGRASRSTTPSRRLACGDLAGGRARRRPEHPWGHKQHKQEGHRPRAHQAARPNNTPRGARNASGATRNTAQGRGPTGPRP